MPVTTRTIAIATALVIVPALSFAQSSHAPLTRADVRAQLIELEQAGYSPARNDDASYPADIQAAEARISAGMAAAQPGTGIGGTTAGTTETGHRPGVGHWRSMYGGH
ncbi:DUF4148 domain-containing protein [Trinickia soli]|uniref:DUF4148 domain-containing protein n=1 Tax=Trinickia soli TaxID=380675 RepID=A0A2N7VUZ3_9BURK|nr:DUF4148 domain-containing protein [Trinickia soli]KAA0089682.1 DUF4148 domain-containing protein [Paraburkholderia sp. T12-10]PMS20976.1 hypothetical protein C0Z19_18945 [Trinickia soli]CAB3664994.1 hypothetical protein LMG24076_01646 [Trinickia soli]